MVYVTLWTVTGQAPLSMGFSRQEHWSGLPFPSPGDLPQPGIEPGTPALRAISLQSEAPGKSPGVVRVWWENLPLGEEDPHPDRGAWWATAHGVAKSWTRLKWLSTHRSTRENNVNFGITAALNFSSVQSLTRVRLFVTPWTTAHQASLSINQLWESTQLMSIESVMPCSHLILCHPLLLLPPIPPSISLFQWVNSSH